MKLTRWLAPSLLTLLCSCATMQQAWVDQYCHKEAAYEKGMNDARSGGTMNSQYAANCPPETRDAVFAGYHEGYSAGVAAEQPQTQVIPVGGPPALINVTIGGGGGVAPVGPDPRAWFCRQHAFTDDFEAFGPTQLEAAQRVTAQCRSKYEEMFCRSSDCRRNQ